MKTFKVRLRTVVTLVVVVTGACIFLTVQHTPRFPRLLSVANLTNPTPTQAFIHADPPVPTTTQAQPNATEQKREGNVVESVIPKGFVDVLKQGVEGTVKPPTKPSVVLKKYSPGFLRQRALTFSNSSALRVFLREEQRRRQHVSEVCQSLQVPHVNTDTKTSVRHGFHVGPRDLLYDRKNQLTFCPIYKSASTSWSLLMLQLAGHYDGQAEVILQPLIKRSFPQVKGFAAKSVTAESTKFMVVRHPLQRLLSCYRDKFQDGNKLWYYTHYGDKMVRRYRRFPSTYNAAQLDLLGKHVMELMEQGSPVVLPGNPFANPVGPTFPEFVSWVIAAKFEDEHWRPYVTHCAPCIMAYNFILRFENMYNEGEQFLQYLNRTGDVQQRWDNPTKNGHTGEEQICSFYNQLTLQQIDKLILKYQLDFDMFEYDPIPYRKCALNYKVANSTKTR